jgi:hypothetical protein
VRAVLRYSGSREGVGIFDEGMALAISKEKSTTDAGLVGGRKQSEYLNIARVSYMFFIGKRQNQ